MVVKNRTGVRVRTPGPEVARVLLLDEDVTSRLTVQAVLQASGYAVDSAASAPEAMDKIEKDQYALVLCGIHAGKAEECRRVMNHAKAQEYKPATALLTSSDDSRRGWERSRPDRVLIEPVEVPALLTKIANLLADRAAGRERRNMRKRRGVELVAS